MTVQVCDRGTVLQVVLVLHRSRGQGFSSEPHVLEVSLGLRVLWFSSPPKTIWIGGLVSMYCRVTDCSHQVCIQVLQPVFLH